MKLQSMLTILKQYAQSKKIRYLIAGGWNTLFGYSSGIALYYTLSTHMHIVLIAILSNIIAITMSFVTYKLFVFRTHGNWIGEYFRSYIVYGGMAVLGIGLLWAMVDGLSIPFWLAQGLVIVVTVFVSYFSHSRFTFRSKNTAPKTTS